MFMMLVGAACSCDCLEKEISLFPNQLINQSTNQRINQSTIQPITNLAGRKIIVGCNSFNLFID
jgi:hypothetical protein